jgi:ABC-type branched-subunit amino acid transport system substrate-binding protein
MAGVVGSRASLARLSVWREWRLLLLGLISLMLAACSGTSNMGSLLSDSPQDQKVAPEPVLESPSGRKVALLLPLSGNGTETVALALKQAAEMALADQGGGGISLVVKDTGGTAAGAKTAAQAALAEGTELILGPLLSAEVEAVSPVASAQNIPVIAFSSVASVARPGTYLMSFLPDQEVSAIFQYGVANGYRNIAALYPRSQYGTAVEESALKYAASFGASVSPVGRFPRENPAASPDIARIAGSLQTAGDGQALFLPEGGSTLKSVADLLERNGVSAANVKLIGTGLWDDAVAPGVSLVQGGWYAGVSPDLVAAFEAKYSGRFGSKPPRIASLAYDAATLAATLAARGGFGAEMITSASGFQGQNGLFRFNRNGLIERGLAILEMTPQGPRELSPPPSRFGAGS